MKRIEGHIGDWVVREYPTRKSVTTYWHKVETFVNELPTVSCGRELRKQLDGGENYLDYVPEAQIDNGPRWGAFFQGHYFCGTCLKSQ